MVIGKLLPKNRIDMELKVKVGDEVSWKSYTGVIVDITPTLVHTKWKQRDDVCKDGYEFANNFKIINKEWD